MNDCDCEFATWLEDASYEDRECALISYRNELEDALDRIKQLELIIRDMKAYSYKRTEFSSSSEEEEEGWSATMEMEDGVLHWVNDDGERCCRGC